MNANISRVVAEREETLQSQVKSFTGESRMTRAVISEGPCEHTTVSGNRALCTKLVHMWDPWRISQGNITNASCCQYYIFASIHTWPAQVHIVKSITGDSIKKSSQK